MSNIKYALCELRLLASVDLLVVVQYGRHVARSLLFCVVGRTRSRSMPLAVLTMRKGCMVFAISMHTRGLVPIVMGLRLVALWEAGASLLKAMARPNQENITELYWNLENITELYWNQENITEFRQWEPFKCFKSTFFFSYWKRLGESSVRDSVYGVGLVCNAGVFWRERAFWPSERHLGFRLGTGLVWDEKTC